MVLAHGDTTTCFATALSSFYHHIPFFHVEAGLRTRLLDSPFPEEFNRQTVTPIATHHFAPTETEKKNLLQDGVSDRAITVTGSTVHDAVDIMGVGDKSAAKSADGFLQNSDKTPQRPLVVVTLHRREGTLTLPTLLQELRGVASQRPEMVFIVPVHPNPIVQEMMQNNLSGMENVQLMPPLSYPRFLALLLKSSLVITDSGGVQEEAAFLGKQVLLARDQTEREDGLATGHVKLIGATAENLQSLIDRSLMATLAPEKRKDVLARRRSASNIIANHIKDYA